MEVQQETKHVWLYSQLNGILFGNSFRKKAKKFLRFSAIAFLICYFVVPWRWRKYDPFSADFSKYLS